MGHISHNVYSITSQVEGVKNSLDLKDTKMYLVKEADLIRTLEQRASGFKNLHIHGNNH